VPTPTCSKPAAPTRATTDRPHRPSALRRLCRTSSRDGPDGSTSIGLALLASTPAEAPPASTRHKARDEGLRQTEFDSQGHFSSPARPRRSAGRPRTRRRTARLKEHDAVGRGRLSGLSARSRSFYATSPLHAVRPQIRGSREQAHRAVAQARPVRPSLHQARPTGHSTQPDAGSSTGSAEQEGRCWSVGAVVTDVEAAATDDAQRAVNERAADSSEARESQDVLTQSVGQRLTRESRDARQPRWKRWFGKG
jgi:hypothetical protein